MAVRASDSEDLNPRPTKRLRHDFAESAFPHATPCHENQGSATLTSPPSLRRLHPAALLLSLPVLLLHPKDHKMYLQSLALARHALKQCLTLPSLEPAEECRAWTGLAELGMMWLETGAEGLGIGEVELALTKALGISQKYPALRLYTPHLTILSARLAQQYQGNSKYATQTLRRILNSLEGSAHTSTSTPSHIILTLYLELIHSLALTAEDEASTASGPPSLGKCLAALNAMVQGAGVGPNLVELLCLVIKLQLLIRYGVWTAVPGALGEAEKAFNEYDAPPSDPAFPSPPVPPTLRTHLLILSVLFHTYAGDAQVATDRLRVLHALLDTGVLELKANKAGVEEGALEGWADGVIEVSLLLHNLYNK
ncbi:hypothetical protein H0H87_003677 [Tephrocybe sp. NHM501043]|nr:hypothetical protein H0H87_003677 [Tephrocybe sp. NHM501043]